MINYRSLNEMNDFADVARLEQLVWQTADVDTITLHAMRVITHTGGCILGAYHDGQMVGCAVGFATRDSDRLWSHFAAVHPDFRRQGIGEGLKRFQREWALEQGYQRMNWTFDPLQSANANFNFRRLGVTAHTYHVNFYGEMQDALNAGMQSDRLQVLWDFSTRTTGKAGSTDAPFALVYSAGKPEIGVTPENEPIRVAIPRHFNAIKAQDLGLAREWQLALRQVFLDALAKNYAIVAFDRGPDSGYYTLSTRSLA